MWQKLPPRPSGRRKQRELYYVESSPTPVVKGENSRGKPKYKIIEEGSSADDSTTTNYSSGLSVDVSNEMAAVNRDIEALLERYENVFDHVLAKHGENQLKREQCGKQTWNQDSQKVHTFEEDPHRNKRHRKRTVKNLTAEQLKLLSMEKPPIDKLREIPFHLLKPRLPPSLKEKKINSGHSQQDLNDSFKGNNWYTKEDILKTMYGDLSKRVCIENSPQDNSKYSKSSAYCSTHTPVNNNTSQIHEINYGDFTCLNENSSTPNVTYPNCVTHPHCCNQNKQFMTSCPNEENNWRTLLGSPKCKIIPVCELQTNEFHKSGPNCACKSTNDAYFEDKISENKAIPNEENNHVEKGINTDPLNWKQILENNKTEISHTYADIRQNYQRKRNSLNEVESDACTNARKINHSDLKNALTNYDNSKPDFIATGDLQNTQDNSMGEIIQKQNQDKILDCKTLLTPKTEEYQEIKIECNKRTDMSLNIIGINENKVLTNNSSPINSYKTTPITIVKKNSYTQTINDEFNKSSVKTIGKENDTQEDENYSHEIQHRATPVITENKSSHTQTFFDIPLLNVEQKSRKPTDEETAHSDTHLGLETSRSASQRNGGEDQSVSVLDMLMDDKDFLDSSKHHSQNPKRRPNSPVLKFEKVGQESVVEESESAGGDTRCSNDCTRKSLVNFIEKTLKRDFFSSIGEDGNKPVDENEIENENLDTNLCVEIIRRMTDSMVKCENSGQGTNMAKESVYLQKLKQLRTDYLKHIQREIKHIEDLDRFLSKFGITAQLVYSTDNPKN